MPETKKEVKEFGPHRSRVYNETLSNYNALKRNIEQYTKAGLPLPPMLRAKLPELNALGASLRRQGLI